jgi:DNA-binding transcriptional MerR regulator
MLNYLARQGYLVPTYVRSGRRGKTRYYSYRDLVIARLVKKLLDAGLEISRLKEGITKLPQNSRWSSQAPERALRMLATDGSSLFFLGENDTLLDLTQQGQLTFAFVLDVAAAQAEVKQKLSAEQLANYRLTNRPLKYA